MIRHPLPPTATQRLHFLMVVTGIAMPLCTLAAPPVQLATEPLVTNTNSAVKPNIMFILDDSGSMDSDYLPDWANDSHPTTKTNYTSMPELFRNNGFNGIAYNPAIYYEPPVNYTATGTLDVATYPSQTGASTKQGAVNNTALSVLGTPNWQAVKDDAYGVQSTRTSNLEGNAYYYTFVPGEYCSTDAMDRCVTSTAPTTVGGIVYDRPALVRWCNSATLSNCQAINTTTYKYPRYPGYTTTTPATSDINLNGGGTASSLKVGVEEILSASVNNNSANRLIPLIIDSINACTVAITGNCTVAGYSAAPGVGKNAPDIVITAPVALMNVRDTPIPSGNNFRKANITAFSGYSAGVTVPGSNLRTDIVASKIDYPKSAKRIDCTAAKLAGSATDSCNYREEMTNYANWWTYYQTRLQAMKTSVSRAFKTLDERFRVGFSTISETGVTNNIDASGHGTFLGNDTFELQHKHNWYSMLFGTKKASATPLRGALSKAGRYYANIFKNQVDPVLYSCQQNFTILSTDGYWNTNDEVTGSYAALDLAGKTITNQDGGTTPRPLYEGSTAISPTLADISKYYHDTDLRTIALGNCGTTDPTSEAPLCTNNVFTSDTDNVQTQHMTTFTMGLGVSGLLNYTADYPTATSGDFYNLKNGLGNPTVNWPDPIKNSGQERIDDLWHAAINGTGEYFSAKNPDQIVDGFRRTLANITAKLGSAAAAATSTLNPVAGNNYAYVASYTTVKWKGNLEARTIDVNTGVISESVNTSDAGGWCAEDVVADNTCKGVITKMDGGGGSLTYHCVTPIASGATCAGTVTGTNCVGPAIAASCTGRMIAQVLPDSDTRTIYTANSPTATPLTTIPLGRVTFVPANLANYAADFSISHINGLSQWPDIQAAGLEATAAGTNLINYLRGQYQYDARGTNATKLYRYREAILGDALESQPVYIGPPVFSFSDTTYTQFKSANLNRYGTVYMGTNDGMLHAFMAKTIAGTSPPELGGHEHWAYIPSMVIPNLWMLADFNYATKHVNFVNGSPIVSDAYNSTTLSWHTILVGGLNGGGRGYYALDVTNPSNPLLLWEFSATKPSPYGDADLGYTFGKPIITQKKDGKWVVLVTSGYNNGTDAMPPGVAAVASPGTPPFVSNSPLGDGKGYLYVLDAFTGKIISKITTGAGSAAAPSGLGGIATWNEAPSTGNLAGYTYGGDLDGNLWRFDINDTATAATIGLGSALKLAILKDALGNTQPMTTAPVLGSVQGQRVVFTGTGKYLEESDLTNALVQTQYAIADNNATVTLNDPRTASGLDHLVQQTIIPNPNGTATRLVADNVNTVDFGTGRGWFADFPDSGERVNIDGNLVLGTLIAPTIVPSNTDCSPGGYGWLNYFNYKTGTAVKDLVSQKTDSPIVGVNVIYIKGKPIVEVVTADRPTPVKPKLDLDFADSSAGFAKKRVLWRQLIP